MIRIKTIHIEEFRGVRNLDLALDGKNFGICGPNGTGKSGVVDAIEFCLTGDVTRLSGHGSAGLSVKAHAPHVDQKGNPDKANVTITADIPALGKAVRIHRSVKNPRKVEITPDTPEVKAVIEELRAHPEFALSRREIVKYVITPPGKRSEDVQTLLRLGHIEMLRKSLTTFAGKRKGEAEAAGRAQASAETGLRNWLKLDKLERELVLGVVNERRALFSLAPIAELTKDTSFKAGVASPKQGETRPALNKAVALADITALLDAFAGGEPAALAGRRQSAEAILGQLKEDEKALTLARQHGFIKTGLELLSDDSCPLCDTPWNADELREHLRGKLLSAEEIEKFLAKLREDMNAVRQALGERMQMLERATEYSRSVTPPVEHDGIAASLETLKQADATLADFQEDHSLLGPALAAVTLLWWTPLTDQIERVKELQARVNAFPDSSALDEAREFLIVAQERYERLLEAASSAKEQEARSAAAQKVLGHYNASRTSVLEGIYDKVADDFTHYYRLLNREDEDDFVGKLSSEPAKLNFDVDFYGRGLFPPGAYHSEGHQDGMGLCLYLALMKHTLGGKFIFAVLDDVLMSVDTGHRREVCRLLKGEFPDTQFILTTHDRVWLQYMKTENLVERSQSFGGWTVDLGPRVWDDHDIWTEIANELDRNDVPKAAGLLRRYLEYIAAILADNLRASVVFRGDAHYDLGDLMPPVLKAWCKRLEDGEKSANRWKLDDKRASLAEARAKAKALVAKTNSEYWAINPSVHFNAWANLQRHEFQDVVDAFRMLLEHLRCKNQSCKSYIYVSPRKGEAEALRCRCGTTNINLK